MPRLLLELSETEELLDTKVASNDDADDMFSVVLEFVSVEVEEVCDCGSSEVEFAIMGTPVLLLEEVEFFPVVIGLLFRSIAGDCSSSEVTTAAEGVGLGGTAVAVGLSRPLLRRCSTT